MNEQKWQQLVWTLADLPAPLWEQAGGKGGTLAQLQQKGYPIPPGFVILPAAWHEGTLRPAAWEQIQAAAASLKATRVAVRSSALGEDGHTISFAGELETVLDVPLATGDAVRAAINQVRASGHSQRVAAYAAAHRVAAPAAVAVVVQAMVDAELAGVLFTADPVTGDHNVMTGNYVHGLGESVVSGAANAEGFHLHRPDGRYEGPAALRPYAARLFRLGRRLARAGGGHQDIEWAITGGQIALLQARPVTTMQGYNPGTGVWNDSRRGLYLWSNANFGEAIPGVMTPLTWSVMRIFGEETFGNPFPGHHPFMGNIGGRFYVNLSLFAALFGSLGLSRERMNAEAEVMFGSLPDDFPIPAIQFSRWQLWRRFLPYALRMVVRRWRNGRQLSEFTATIPALFAELKSKITAVLTPEQLAALWQAELEPLLRRAYQMLQVGTSRYENSYRSLQKELAQQVGPEQANLLLSGVSSDDEQLASLNPLLGLWQIQQGQLSREAYRQRYGHRGVHEMELDWARPAEDRDWLPRQLATMADQDVPALLQARSDAKAAAWAEYERAYPKEAPATRRKIEIAAAAARGREAIRSEVTRLLFLVRHFALRAGVLTGLGDDVFYLWLAELRAVLQGQPAPQDEVPIRRQAHRRLSALPPYPALINGRFDPKSWANDPARRSDLFDGINHAPIDDRADDPDTLHGVPGSTGVATGRVRRLDSADDGHLLQPGEILVATTTNVGWTPLFPRAAAIVTDVGAPLSHAAIVARELGLPAVVGTGRATMILQTGDYVRVDGGRGLVQRLSPDTAP